MKRRFILYRRKRGGMFYVEDTETHKQESTGTRNRAEATALLNARNESVRQPQLNLQIAKAYLAGTDSGVSKRTWQDAFNAITENKHGSTAHTETQCLTAACQGGRMNPVCRSCVFVQLNEHFSKLDALGNAILA